MSKRRINKQQSARIEKIQQDFLNNADSTDLADGLVITRFRNKVEIEDIEGNITRCSIRPNLETLVAGDRVVWQRTNAEQGVVVSQYPRKSVLARPTYNNVIKPVAANLTQLIIVIAPKPEISWSLLDSYLVLAETLHLNAVIVLNKIDLSNKLIESELDVDYKSLGYPILGLSTFLPTSMLQLESFLKDQVSVFVGQSGVGKSSIISYFLPQINTIAIGGLSESSELGCHTTSNSTYYHLDTGGAVIDSPGVREFQLPKMSINEIASGYREIKPFLSHCKFRNCIHQNSLGCAIINALKQGIISKKRYHSYLKLCEGYS